MTMNQETGCVLPLTGQKTTLFIVSACFIRNSIGRILAATVRPWAWLFGCDSSYLYLVIDQMPAEAHDATVKLLRMNSFTALDVTDDEVATRVTSSKQLTVRSPGKGST